MNLTIDDAKVLLKKHFGYDDFRSGQKEIISHIISGQDTLGIMPTGAGKSICYQIPAMLFDGVTIVISPLISLMKDQVDNLNQIGIPATFINSSLSSSQYFKIINNAYKGMYKIIYVAPERLDSERFLDLLNKINISMFAIDEAHCISRWGHDFRPSYMEIANVILNLKKRPVVTAFTATATIDVKNDIINLLHLSDPFVLTTGFDRKNLYFSVKSPENRKKFVIDYIQNHLDISGIVYCLTRKSVDMLYDTLEKLSISVSKYHGGMTDKERSLSQEDFVYDRTSVMIATNAFGMGIDKSNIRYVIHYNMPRDLESYYQEAGRAGRDGDFSDCILLFSRADIVTNKLLIEQGSSERTHSNEINKLNDMVDYCNTDKCLRKYILEYFGETPSFSECNNCSNCDSEIEVTDITTDSQKILSCIKRMHERFGLALVSDVLKGSNTSKIRSMGFNDLSTYAIMKDYSKDTIKDLISFLISENYIATVGEQYPVLRLTGLANDVLFNNKSVFIKRKIEKLSDKKSTSISDTNYEDFDADLFSLLKDVRMDFSRSLGIPPFIIFADVSLKQMAKFYPTNSEEFLCIDGVGDYKLKQYGDVFLDVISGYVSEHNIKKDDFLNLVTKKDGEVSYLKDDNFDNDIPEKSEKPHKQDTKIVTYNLFMEGKSPLEISNIRDLTLNTIQNHLIACFENGLPIDLSNYINLDAKDLVFDAIRECGTDKLKPIKEALPSNISYFDIKYFLVCFKKTQEF